MTQMYFNIKNAIILALSISALLFLPSSIFAQGAIVGYADGNTHVNEDNLTSFPSNAQLDRLTHVIAVGLGVYTPSEIEDREKEWNQCIALLHSLKLALPSKRISIALLVAHPGYHEIYPDQTLPTFPIPRQIWNIVDAIQLMT